MTEAPYGYLYQITNKVNGKTYIGIRKTGKDKYWREYMGSGKLIKQAISKYGQEQFIKTLVLYSDTREELYSYENDAIKEAKDEGKAEYNLTLNIPYSDSYELVGEDKKRLWRERLSIAQKRLRNDPSYASPSTTLFEQRYIKFCSEHEPSFVVDKYRELNSYSETAVFFNTSKRIMKKFLEKNGIVFVSRTKPGYKKTYEERLAASNAMRRKLGLEEKGTLEFGTCKYCGSDINARRRVCDDCREKKKSAPSVKKKYFYPKKKKEAYCKDCGNKVGAHNKLLLCRTCKETAEGKIKGFTPDELASFTSHLKDPGISVREVSRRTGFSVSKVKRFMREFGYEIPPQSTTAAHEARRKKRTITDKECPSCKNTFSPRRSDTKTCSVECGHELRRTQGSTRI